MTETKTLAGSVALVTGASSGLGHHFAQVLSRAGAAVALAARRVERLEQLAKTIEQAGGRPLVVCMDVADTESVRLAFDRIEAVLGAPGIIVNNAGTAIAKPLLEQTESDWDAVIDTNLKGAFLVSTEAARRLRAHRRGGSIINIASILGLRQQPGLSPYAASKAGVLQLTRNMALELARFDLRVNAIAPGYIDTEMNHELWDTREGAELIKRVPQRRLGKPEDLDGALLLLAGEGSRYMTGSVLVADGGHHLSSL
jgi:NAD(P)-dependent dehydrogenase (short-subunit alcohol dehydrogenase family)